MYETGWTKLCWPDVPITPGTVVGVLGRQFRLRSLNACRIVYVIEEKEASLLKRYGFAVGTLPGHVERGGECFTVEWHRAEDSVFYEVFAFARPVHPLARVGPPSVRMIQRRFAATSLRAMAATHHSTFQFPRGRPTPFRGPLRFIVIAVTSVMSGTFPDTYGVSARRSIPGVSGDRHIIVTIDVTKQTPYLSGLLAGVTVMTLMTVVYGLILDRGCASTS